MLAIMLAAMLATALAFPSGAAAQLAQPAPDEPRVITLQGLDRALDPAPPAPDAAPPVARDEDTRRLRIAPTLQSLPDTSASPEPAPPQWPSVARWLLLAVLTLILWRRAWQWWIVFTQRHNLEQPDYAALRHASWPAVTVLVAVREPSSPIEHAIDGLLAVDYPPERLRIRIAGHLSALQRGIAADYAARFPDRVHAAPTTHMADAVREAGTEFIVLMRAEWLPSRGFLKRVIAPCFDPAVGAVVGPLEAPPQAGGLAYLNGMARAAFARVLAPRLMLRRVPPLDDAVLFAVRRAALAAAGGWRETGSERCADLAWRLLAEGWLTQHITRSECTGAPRVTPQSPVLSMLRHVPALAFSPRIAWWHKGALLGWLGHGLAHVLPALAVILAFALYVAGDVLLAGIALALVALGALKGQSITLFAAGAISAGHGRQLRMLPMSLQRAVGIPHASR